MELVIKSFNVSREFDELKIILMMNLEINSLTKTNEHVANTRTSHNDNRSCIISNYSSNKAASNEQRHFFNTSYLH